jgi:metallo-beta-lactamase family protein
VIESTYGNRLHERDDMGARLEGILKRTIERGGSVLIPAFAAGRAQLLLYHLKRLRDQGRLPNVPVYLNSPMAGSVNALYQQFAEDHRLVQEEIDEVCGLARATATADDSKALNEDSSPKIVIAASGMATGGRVLHHLKKMGPDPRSTLLFVGFQAAGTRGEAIVNGAEEIKIHGQFWPIRADVINLDSMSAHADAAELIRWASAMHPRPKGIFVTHGEVRAAEAFAERISSELGVQATVPDLGTSVVLD